MRAEVQRPGSPGRVRLAGGLSGRAYRPFAGLGLGFALLLLPPAAATQEVVSPQAGVVKITGLREGASVQGSGFVVSLDREKAVIVTASHVIEGVQSIEVSFAADPSERFSADTLGAEFGNPRGLAVLQVRGALPAGISPLAFETEAQPEPGEDLIVLGFPNRQARTPLTLRRAFAGPDGSFLQLDRPSGEGISGAPVLRRGRVVGLVVDEDPQLTYAVGAVVVRATVSGWRVKATTAPAPPARTQPQRDPSPGSLVFEIEPDDASVYVDGRFVGTPKELEKEGLKLPPGRYRVAVVRPGRLPREMTVDIASGAKTEVSAKLQRAPVT